MAFTIDIPNRRLITDAAVNTIQEINDAARGFEDEQNVMSLDNRAGEPSDGIIVATGKNNLGAGVFEPVTVKLINNWRLYHAPMPGPSWLQVQVIGGTLIAANDFGDNPVEDSAFVNWKIPVAQAGALLNIADLIRLRQWMTNRQELSEAAVDNFILYEDDGVTVAEKQTVLDPTGGTIVLPAGTPAQRSTSVEQ